MTGKLGKILWEYNGLNDVLHHIDEDPAYVEQMYKAQNMVYESSEPI